MSPSVARLLSPLLRRHAPRFVEHAEAMLAANHPRTAGFLLQDAERLRYVSTAELRRKIDSAVAAEDEDTPEYISDLRLQALLALTDWMGGEALKPGPKLAKPVAKWLRLRVNVAKELGKLATAYRKKGEIELAYELAKAGEAMQSNAMEDLAKELRLELSTAQALRRYEEVAKPCMEDFRTANRKLGGSKRWRFDGMVITMPPASKEPAMLISERRLAGDYEIEAELQLKLVTGMVQVVLAWRGEDNYCALEFERSHEAAALLRIVHVRDGDSTRLAEALARRTLSDYVTVRGTVRGGEVEIMLGATSCNAKLPFDIGEGVAFGLVRPGLQRELRRSDERAVIHVRNLVVTER